MCPRTSGLWACTSPCSFRGNDRCSRAARRGSRRSRAVPGRANLAAPYRQGLSSRYVWALFYWACWRPRGGAGWEEEEEGCAAPVLRPSTGDPAITPAWRCEFRSVLRGEGRGGCGVSCLAPLTRLDRLKYGTAAHGACMVAPPLLYYIICCAALPAHGAIQLRIFF